MMGSSDQDRSGALSDESRRTLEQLLGIGEDFRRVMARLTEQVAPLVKAFAQAQDKWRPIFQEIAARYAAISEQHRALGQLLALNGWYIEPDSTPAELFERAELFVSGEGSDLSVVHKRLCAHYNEGAAAFRESLIRRFPDRSRILSSAFEAHQRKDYAASVALFLTQADGICSQLIDEQLYRRGRDGKPRLAAILSDFDDTFFLTAVLTPLMQPSPLSANEGERQSMPTDILNRHIVLHGVSTDYDTELNSCRAMSLLVYVAWAIQLVRGQMVIELTSDGKGASRPPSAPVSGT